MVAGGEAGMGQLWRESKIASSSQRRTCLLLSECLTEPQEPYPRGIVLAWETQPYPSSKGLEPWDLLSLLFQGISC